jgi:hypothetical protein
VNERRFLLSIIKYNLDQWYHCAVCDFLFSIHSRLGSGRGGAFCPKCGENADTKKINRPSLSSRQTYRPWKEHEIEMLKKVVTGEMYNYEVALLLGRSKHSMHRRLERLKKEMEENE